VTRTIRQPVTRTFTSTGPITIPSGAPTTSNKGPANPYPSAIAVSGFSNGTITDVNLILTDYSHTVPTDVDVLLSTSDGRQALVLSDVSNDPVTSIDLTLDDEAAASMPAVEQGVDLTSGTFRPTNHTYYDDSFATPAPALNGNVALSGFDGTDPNGTWRLWVTDNAGGDHGDLSGWALQITAEVDTGTVDEQVPVTKTKKHKKHGKKRR
jgi:hypothetical protein